VPLTAGELARGHRLILLRGNGPVAYVGWAACTIEQGRRFVGLERIVVLDFVRREGEAMAFRAAAASSPRPALGPPGPERSEGRRRPASKRPMQRAFRCAAARGRPSILAMILGCALIHG
jgi:hypothetical protein